MIYKVLINNITNIKMKNIIKKILEDELWKNKIIYYKFNAQSFQRNLLITNYEYNIKHYNLNIRLIYYLSTINNYKHSILFINNI